MARRNWIIGKLRISATLEEDLLKLRQYWVLDLLAYALQIIKSLVNRKNRKRRQHMKDFAIEHVLEQVVFDLNPVTTIIDKLDLKGYSKTFELKDGVLRCSQNHERYPLADMAVDAIYRFEDDSGIMGRFFMFALRHRESGVMGILVTERSSLRLQFNGSTL